MSDNGPRGRTYAELCGSRLDFAVSRAGPRTREVQVELAVRELAGPLDAAQLRVTLLDPAGTPLPRVHEPPAAGLLPWMTLSGSTSAFTAELFDTSRTAPSHLAVELDGHRDLFPLPARPKRQEVRRQEGVATPTSPTPAAAKPKCCPDELNAPKGNLPTTLRDLPNPNGAPVGALVLCQPWVITASFKDPPPPECRCTCCSYRQYMKGSMTMTLPQAGAKPMNVTPVTDYLPPAKPPAGAPAPAPGAPPPQPQPVQGIGANYVEDTKGDPRQPGKPQGYGHRDDLGIRPGMQMIAQDYPTGCSYWGLDFPQGGGPKGSTVKIDVTWKGAIVDTCNGDAELQAKEWSWTFNAAI